MDIETFAARAEVLAAAAEADAAPVRVSPEARPHPFVAGHRTYVEAAPGGEEDAAGAGCTLFHGSFRETAAVESTFDFDGELGRGLGHARGILEEDGHAAEAVRDDEALFEAHALFRRGKPVPPGWHRRGESLAPGVWVVDLDVFVDVVLRSSEWEALRGGRLLLTVLDDEWEIDLAAEAALDEVWTLPECGLFEPAPGVEDVDLEEAEDDALPGRFGDLHVVPYAF